MFSRAKRISVYTEAGVFITSVLRKEQWRKNGMGFVQYDGRMYQVYEGYPSPLKQYVASPHIVIEDHDLYKM
jgi:hypothetical protein